MLRSASTLAAPLAGNLVVVHGMKGRTDLNGKTVELVEWRKASGRWAAKTKEVQWEVVQMKPLNLLSAHIEQARLAAAMQGSDALIMEEVIVTAEAARVDETVTSMGRELLRRAKPPADASLTNAAIVERRLEHSDAFERRAALQALGQ
eukprot:5818701-Prymnesium_polylepis.1